MDLMEAFTGEQKIVHMLYQSDNTITQVALLHE